jgi:hypothetical protein
MINSDPKRAFHTRGELIVLVRDPQRSAEGPSWSPAQPGLKLTVTDRCNLGPVRERSSETVAVGSRLWSLGGFLLAFAPGLLALWGSAAVHNTATSLTTGAVGLFLIICSVEDLGRTIRPNRLHLDADSYGLGGGLIDGHGALIKASGVCAS